MPDASETTPPASAYRLSVEEYNRIVHAGVFETQDQVELVEGFIVRKTPGDKSHPLAAKQAMLALLRVLSPGWHVASEKSVVASDWSKPEPDLAVVRGQARDYLQRDVTAGDVALVVKIAQSSLEQDRTVMARVYATSGIPVYWILNLVDQQTVHGSLAALAIPEILNSRQALGRVDVANEELSRDPSLGCDRSVTVQLSARRPLRVRVRRVHLARNHQAAAGLQVDSDLVNRTEVTSRGDGGADIGIKANPITLVVGMRCAIEHEIDSPIDSFNSNLGAVDIESHQRPSHGG
jgi:Uma2 family endonuclease